MESYGVARNTLQDFIGICESKITDKEKDNTKTVMDRDCSGKPVINTLGMRYRAALSKYKAQVRKYKEDRTLLPFFPLESLPKEYEKIYH